MIDSFNFYSNTIPPNNYIYVGFYSIYMNEYLLYYLLPVYLTLVKTNSVKL